MAPNRRSITQTRNPFRDAALFSLILERLPFEDLALERYNRPTSPAMRLTMFISARPIELVTVFLPFRGRGMPAWLRNRPQPSLHHDDALVGSPGALVVSSLHPLLRYTGGSSYESETNFGLDVRLLRTPFEQNIRNGFVSQPPCKQVTLSIAPTNNGWTLKLKIIKDAGVKVGNVLGAVMAKVGDKAKQIDLSNLGKVHGHIPDHIPVCSPWARGAREEMGGLREDSHHILKKSLGGEWEAVVRTSAENSEMMADWAREDRCGQVIDDEDS
ncbi:hypothetical protein LTR86_009350 [Recurvomyces mirabilis]|nr:hypothetical protein LTR86_009350 [Recurvomyces mirabilis]